VVGQPSQLRFVSVPTAPMLAAACPPCDCSTAARVSATAQRSSAQAAGARLCCASACLPRARRRRGAQHTARAALVMRAHVGCLRGW